MTEIQVRVSDLQAIMIMAIRCDEPEGPKIRGVFAVRPTVELLAWLWDHVQHVPSMFSMQKAVQPEQIMRLLKPTVYTWLVDDVGLLVAERTHNAVHVHITFWDRRLRGREELCRTMARYVQQNLAAPRIYTTIPASSKAVLAFAKRVGFRPVEWVSKGTVDAKGNREDLVVLDFTP